MTAVVVAAHETYIIYVMSCVGCYAPTKRHCSVGRSLRIEYDAQFLMTISDTRQRRLMLLREAEQNPANADGLKARVIELFNDQQEEAQ